MPLENSLLKRKSSLTDTKNKLLQESELLCPRKYLTGPSKWKYPLLTDLSLRNESDTVNKILMQHKWKERLLKLADLDDRCEEVEMCADSCDVYPEELEAERVLDMQGENLELIDESEMQKMCGLVQEEMRSRVSCQRQRATKIRSPQAQSLAFGFSAPLAHGFPKGARLCSSAVLMRSAITQVPRRLEKMPAYHFQSLPFKESTEADYKALEEDSELLFKNKQKEVKRIKMRLLNAVSTSLLFSPDFKKTNDSFRMYLLKCAEDVVCLDPEFILKVALYVRQELNIRSTANFLLAFSANENSCKPFLKAYFEASIALPTDWIRVAEMYLVFKPDAERRSLPAALRKVLKSSFTKFDNYQLAKYNRKAKKSSVQKKVGESSNDEIKQAKQGSYSLKQLIRLLHITSPVEPVMCILGKKYPSDPAIFRQHGLPGIWDSAKAGKRMKLPIPETWEATVSAKGNKAEVWESLIDNAKLPYMATLRNLRNLIMSGISKRHHEKVRTKLSQKNAVTKSRQFPLRFYAAFKVLEDIEKLYHKKDQATSSSFPRDQRWRVEQKKVLLQKIEKIDIGELEKYKEALSNALEISANHNLDPVGGRTLIISDLTDNYSEAAGGAVEYFNKRFHSCLLLSLMCLKACEECEVKAILNNGSTESVVLKSKLFLENMSELCSKYAYSDVDCNRSSEEVLDEQLPVLLEHYLKTQILLHLKLDNIIFLKTSSGSDENIQKIISNFLRKYRHVSNPNLLYIQVDLSVDTKKSENLPTSEEENDIYLAGFSEHIFKFIAERSNGGQLAYIENIDKKYRLEKKQSAEYSENAIKNNLLAFGQKIEIYSGIPKWQTARIFISSTFKDMHGERDLLLRYVFPELKARAASLFVKINEIDLRWGISETDSLSNRSNQICLLEAQNCDLFIGILGERYGTRCSFDENVDPSLSWVKDHSDSSVTELEMLCGALNRKSSREKAFFFFRSSEFMRGVPPDWQKFFESESPYAKQKLDDLKDKIRFSGMEIYDGYPCHFTGIYEGNPIVAGLDSFGQRVLDNLWNAVNKFYKKEDENNEMSEEETFHQMVANSFNCFLGEKSSPLDRVIKELKNKPGIFVVTGKPGCGKTAFISQVLKKIKNDLIIPYFIGASSQSADLSYMLCYIGNSIISKLPLDISVPNTKESLLNNFPDIITEGSKAAFPGSLVIVIDGLDYLDVEAQTLSWLPYDLPNGFRLICSTSDSSEAFVSLMNREKNGSPVHYVPLQPLIVSDRQELVRHYLKQHGKALDESSFNNQMLHLVTKQDSGNPLYLQVACDYLKNFAVFENLVQKLQTFPSLLTNVLEEIIIQMEKFHGITVVQNALNLMCIAKEGLEEKDMHILLSVSKPNVLKDSPDLITLADLIVTSKLEDMLPPVSFCSLVHMLKIFAYPFGNLSHGSLRLASKTFASVVTKHYCKNTSVPKWMYHRLLAAYYHIVCNPKSKMEWSGSSGNSNSKLEWSGSSVTAVCGLLYHLLHGKCYTELAQCLCDHSFLQAAFNMNAGEELPEYYGILLNDIVKSVPLDQVKIQDYGNFVDHNMNVLKSWPFLVYQQALNEPVDSWVYKERTAPNGYTLECITRSCNKLNCRPKVLDGFAKNVVCVKTHSLRSIAALGVDDGSAKILNTVTGKVLSSLRGHSSTITSLCFLGKDRICLSSADCTLSIWSCSEHYRIAVLEGHTRFISSCCCDPQGNVVSAGWDCTVRFWSSRDASLTSCISTIRSPINSIAHHPEQQLIACGLWNKTIEIWNTLLLTKKSKLRGHSSSVRSVVFSPKGLYMLSSSLCAEVFIWSTNEYLKIAKLSGHTSSVNSISCSLLGSYIVTASDDTTLKVWPDEHQVVKMTIQEFKTHPVHFMEIVSQLLLAVAFQNSTIRVFDLTDGHVVQELNTTSDPVTCFSKFNGRAGGQCKTCVDLSVEVLIFGTKSGKAMELKFENALVTEVSNLNSHITVMLHTECIAFCGTTNGDLALLSFVDGIPHGILYAAHEHTITSLSISSSGMSGQVLSASADKTVKLWDFGEQNGKEDLMPKLAAVYPSKHRDSVTSCCIYRSTPSSEVKTVMVTGSYDNHVIIWDDEKEQTLSELKTSVLGVYYTGKYIIACGSEGSIAVWTQNGKCVSSIPGIEKSSPVIAFDFQKEKMTIQDFDATLAFVENDGSISIRRPFQRSSICTLPGHADSVTSCDINENNVILSCSLDKTVNIWKLPKFTTSSTELHSGKINTVALSLFGNLAFSGDVHGNLILWNISGQEEEEQPMKYITQKKYTGGSVIAVQWMKDNRAVCAVQIHSKAKENSFIEILNCKPLETSSSFTLQMQQQKFFSCEITSVDYLLSVDTIAVGLKSGHIFLMNSSMQKEVKVATDWILKVSWLAAPDPMLYVAGPDSLIKRFSFSKLCNNQTEPEETIDQCLNDKPWITALNCDSEGVLFFGDTSGRVSAYHEEEILTKQAHTAAVSHICIAENLLFTCSLDRTVKIWDTESCKQVGQFHSQSPICCLAAPGGTWNPSTSKSFSLIYGTTVGDVHLLRLESGGSYSPSANTSMIFGGDSNGANTSMIFGGDSKEANTSMIFGGGSEGANNSMIFGGGSGGANNSMIFGGGSEGPNNSTVFGNLNLNAINNSALVSGSRGVNNTSVFSNPQVTDISAIFGGPRHQ